MEGEAEVVAATIDLVDDGNAARRPVQLDDAAVARRRVQRQIAIVLRGPLGDVAEVGDIKFPAVRMAQPEERAAVAGLVPPVEFDRVMRDRRAEVRTPFW